MDYLFPLGSQFGRDNLVLNARATRHVVKDFRGPLSIKSVLDGAVTWKVGKRDFVVDPNSFLVLGDGESYSMDVEVARPIETCCVFFRKRYVEEIAHDATTPLDASLKTPGREAPPLELLSRLHHDGKGAILPHLRSVRDRCSIQLQPSSVEEDFLLLTDKLIHLYKEVRAQMARVPAAKKSTREELFRRLQIAREYLHGDSGALSLETVAKEACLSRYHLHRSFTQVFRQTPHAYLTTIRMGRAQALLRQGRSVTETALDVGFESIPSFSRLYRAHFGQAPSKVRKNG